MAAMDQDSSRFVTKLRGRVEASRETNSTQCGEDGAIAIAASDLGESTHDPSLREDARKVSAYPQQFQLVAPPFGSNRVVRKPDDPPQVDDGVFVFTLDDLGKTFTTRGRRFTRRNLRNAVCAFHYASKVMGDGPVSHGEALQEMEELADVADVMGDGGEDSDSDSTISKGSTAAEAVDVVQPFLRQPCLLEFPSLAVLAAHARQQERRVEGTPSVSSLDDSKCA